MVSAPERLATVILLTLALVAVPVSMWRHGVLGPLPAALGDSGWTLQQSAGPAGGPQESAGPAAGQPQGAGAAGVPPQGVSPGGTDMEGGPYESTGSGEGGGVVVHVAGAVRHPGVYRLPGGARVVDAIRAAGGEKEGGAAWALNLAARVVDGDRIYVPTGREVADYGSGSSWRPGGGVMAGGAPARPVDINHASVEELDTVPGIGPALAQRIVAFRRTNGPFARVEDLTRVPGIGPKTLESMREWLVTR